MGHWHAIASNASRCRYETTTHTHMQFKCWNWPMFKYTRNNNMNYSIKNAHISINCFQFWFYWILSHFSHYRSWAKWIVTIPFLFRLVTKHNNLLIANQHLMIINRARTIKIVCGPCMVRSDTRYDQHEKKWFGLILTIEMEWRDSIAENGWRGQNSWINKKKKLHLISEWLVNCKYNSLCVYVCWNRINRFAVSLDWIQFVN